MTLDNNFKVDENNLPKYHRVTHIPMQNGIHLDSTKGMVTPTGEIKSVRCVRADFESGLKVYEDFSNFPKPSFYFLEQNGETEKLSKIPNQVNIGEKVYLEKNNETLEGKIVRHDACKNGIKIINVNEEFLVLQNKKYIE